MQNKDKRISIIATAIILTGLLMCIAVYSCRMYTFRYKPVLNVGGHNISQCEYDYFYTTYYRYYINNFSSFFDYMGVDPNVELKEQMYDENMTFGELFEKSTVVEIKRVYALYDDAIANNFDYNPNIEYEEYIKKVEDTCKSSGISIKEYFTTFYGKNVSVNLIKKYMLRGFYANAYYEKLIDDTSETEAYDYTEELKKKMDTQFYVETKK